MTKTAVKPLFLLLLLMVLFYWKILLTNQFSLLTESEGVNQGYSWYHFSTANLKQGRVPLWDPYTFSGHSFTGEMQTAGFYPLNVLLALFPFNRNGMFSPQLYHLSFVLAHFLAACFMFALVRELALRRLSATIAAVCFALGGFVGRVPWPHMLQSSIWLPVIFLFLLRALRSGRTVHALINAACSGLGLAMAILAGGFHVVIMQVLVILTGIAFYTCHAAWQPGGFPTKRRPWAWVAMVTGVVFVLAIAGGAVQWFPSLEYSRQAVRFLGQAGRMDATQKIPYAYVRDGLAPQGIGMFLMFLPFNGKVGTIEDLNPYLGVFPLLLAMVGTWKSWSILWVRYLAGLLVAAFLFSLGSFSLLYGVLYAVVPFLWMAREAPRFLYIADFALAVLAAYGAETLFSDQAKATSWERLIPILKWVAVVLAVAACVPAIFGQPEINPWNLLSILFIIACCGFTRYITWGHTGRAVQVFALAFILFDLSAFDWTARNKIDAIRSGTDQFVRLLSCRGAAAFLNSRSDLFRVQVQAEVPPNIGDVFGIQTVGGGGATLPINYERFINHAPHAIDLLNVRYIVKPASTAEPGPLYEDSKWKIYENSSAYPRAWLVHQTAVEAQPERLMRRLATLEVDPHRVALLSRPLDVKLDSAAGSPAEHIALHSYEADKLELVVIAEGRALLVLSEIFYPGWQASVNGRAARIYEVDGTFRGIVVNSGESHVTVKYLPVSVYAGAVLTLIAFAGTVVVVAWHWRNEKRVREHQRVASVPQ